MHGCDSIDDGQDHLLARQSLYLHATLQLTSEFTCLHCSALRLTDGMYFRLRAAAGVTRNYYLSAQQVTWVSCSSSYHRLHPHVCLGTKTLCNLLSAYIMQMTEGYLRGRPGALMTLRA